MIVTVRDHAIHQQPRQYRDGEREKLEENRHDHDPRQLPRLADDALDVAPYHRPSAGDWPEFISRLKCQGHSRKRTTELLHRHKAWAASRVNNLDAILA